jgi:rubrerythrin
MKLIEKLTDRIDEEIEDVKYYAKLATEVKAEYPTLAQVLFNISTQEDGHQAAIHNEVVKIIEEHRRNHCEPPAPMMAVYDYLHKKSIDKLAKARMYQDVYKST